MQPSSSKFLNQHEKKCFHVRQWISRKEISYYLESLNIFSFTIEVKRYSCQNNTVSNLNRNPSICLTSEKCCISDESGFFLSCYSFYSNKELALNGKGLLVREPHDSSVHWAPAAIKLFS